MQSQKPCTFRSLLTLRSETMIRVEKRVQNIYWETRHG